ncbi:ferritin [[Haemophilus] ducreyi]|uniref:Ferritin n=2 Tax=Haemophilus ducreyi TaxID=730 RepID=Q7VKV7_HAEDU|nr:non-heme ferritin [[Haemophilus] ducreyi]AAP96510.1 Ferritin-like protein 2 [[Haemophilus] ducreyi 35000HP]AKO31367.1 ferritin [[Haemophilus] ducreyi]AKO32818.1 ferritin [[Haemophilus] ducreyi]AKO34267.1 ferritin [[Haemophilus] ducreyi]AKO35710.1 ferritin [[Haemophilus] ducreyi]
MLPQNMVQRLNEQLNLELYSSNFYLQMSAWADKNGFAGAAKFLKAHATEEMQHMRRLFSYLNETGSSVEIAAIEAPIAEYASLKALFEMVLEHEKYITTKINQLVDTAFEMKDYATFNFLQWYVAEQHEEEFLFNTILNKFNLLGEDGKALYYIDKDLASYP